jgi:hypothetical protein
VQHGPHGRPPAVQRYREAFAHRDLVYELEVLIDRANPAPVDARRGRVAAALDYCVVGAADTSLSGLLVASGWRRLHLPLPRAPAPAARRHVLK